MEDVPGVVVVCGIVVEDISRGCCFWCCGYYV